MGPGHIQPDPLSITSLSAKHQEIIEYVNFRLGNSMIDVELNPSDYAAAIRQSLVRYRQRSSNSVEESYAFLDILPDTQEYILPKEIVAVKRINRRGLGGLQNSTQFEPFSSGFLNTYMLVSGRVGGLLSYELFVDYQKLTMTMFGGYVTFNYDPGTRKLVIHRKFPGEFGSESVLLEVSNFRPDQAILNDNRAFAWIQDYSYELCKHTVGEARELFAQINGPAGGAALNGAAMKAEAQAGLDKLMIELTQFTAGETPLSFIIG
jgi:hypothetical protein